MEIIAVKDLNFTYPGCEDRALKNINFSVDAGQFVVICGATGSGKSTLLRMLKREISPLGERTGSIYFKGEELGSISDFTAATCIGYVMQRPEQQLVTDKVWHELAFGLENLDYPQPVMRRRVSEMAAYFGIEDWYEKRVDELSGGQKQLLNLAAVMVMQPDVLILDEPTAQLDPIAAADFLSTVYKLNRETGLTVILVEHRLEDAIPLCDRLLVLKDGEVLTYDEPRKVCNDLRSYPDLLEAMPASVRVHNAVGSSAECPLTVREGRDFIQNNFTNNVRTIERECHAVSEEPALEFRDIWFRYTRETPDVLKGTDVTINKGEVFCILGGNGSGKSTFLSVASGINRAYSGTVKVLGKKIGEYKNQSLYRNCLTLLPQDVQTVFLHPTVRQELEECGADVSMIPYDVEKLLDKHPYDLSGGEQQLVALAKVLATSPKILLMDEPTKGIDAHSKKGIAETVKKLKADGMTVVIVTHDVEFAADIADRCAMFFRGEFTSVDVPEEFFAWNNFYTTVVNRMTRGYYDHIVTVDDAVKVISLNGGKK